jgi:transcriptional regulator with XRE-family HTH domain
MIQSTHLRKVSDFGRSTTPIGTSADRRYCCVLSPCHGSCQSATPASEDPSREFLRGGGVTPFASASPASSACPPAPPAPQRVDPRGAACVPSTTCVPSIGGAPEDSVAVPHASEAVGTTELGTATARRDISDKMPPVTQVPLRSSLIGRCGSILGVGATFTVRRRRLTNALRRLREENGLTIDDVAREIGLSKSAISRIENGLVELKLPVLRALLTLYHVTGDQADDLERLMREAAQKGWWQYSADIQDATRTLAGLEAEGVLESDFSSSLVTGLLQTAEYAGAVLRAARPHAPSAKIETAVEFRLRRQERLGTLRLWSILTEEVLMRPIGGADVMKRQLEHLIHSAGKPQITVQILDLTAGAHASMGGSFVIVGFDSPSDPEAVYLEGQNWDACVEDREEVKSYKESFELLRASALSPDESVKFLQRRAKEFSREQ